MLRVSQLHFTYEGEASEAVGGVSFMVHKGRTLGVLGRNECGKTTLAKLLLGQLTPSAGSVQIDGKPLPPEPLQPAVALSRRLLLLSVVVTAILARIRWEWFLLAWEAGVYALLLLLGAMEAGRTLREKLDRSQHQSKPGWASSRARAAGLAYISSEHNAAQEMDPHLTIEAAISQQMPPMSHAARRREVLAALQVSGFQMYTNSGQPTGNPETYLADGVTLGQCSGGQRHLIFILSVLASRPTILIADEMLCGLDMDRQASVLTMLQRLQARTGMCILFMSVDLAPISIMSHDIAFMHDGCFIEVSPAHTLVESPQKIQTKSYINDCLQLEKNSRGKNLRNVFLTGESIFDL